jgi:hypothetical protein
MTKEQYEQVLQRLAMQIEQRRLLIPIRLFVDTIAPIGVIASQFALFVRPFAPTNQWQEYLDVLSDQQAWSAFQRILNSKEC